MKPYKNTQGGKFLDIGLDSDFFFFLDLTLKTKATKENKQMRLYKAT